MAVATAVDSNPVTLSTKIFTRQETFVSCHDGTVANVDESSTGATAPFFILLGKTSSR